MNDQAQRTLLNLKDKVFLVTGGGGYVGNRIILELIRCHAKAIVVCTLLESWCGVANELTLFQAADINFPNNMELPKDLEALYKRKVTRLKLDIRNEEQVFKALEGVDLVFHTASFGMSGADMLNVPMVQAVNVGGTEKILKSCKANGVSGLVYTSSANAVFSGKYEMPDIDEDLPFNKLEDCVDEYSRTKCTAEQLVVKASGENFLNGMTHNTNYKLFCSCAVRPAAIYGEGEQRHFPRIIGMMEKGMLKFNIGSPDSKVDWVHVDNLVYGHLLAGAKILGTEEDRKLVGGKSYYISDKNPMNNFLWMRPLVEGLGYDFPKIWIPFKVVFYLAWFLEIIHAVVSPFYKFTPLMSRAEVCKVGVTHYFRTTKAERELGWSLVISPSNGMNKMVKYFQELETTNVKPPRRKDGNSIFLLGIVLSVIAAMIIAYWK